MMTVALAADLVRRFQLLCCDGTWRATPGRRLSACGPCMLPAGSCTGPGERSSGSSTAGPPPTRCSTPTGASNPSPEPQTPPTKWHQVDDARPDTPPGSPLAANECPVAVTRLGHEADEDFRLGEHIIEFVDHHDLSQVRFRKRPRLRRTSDRKGDPRIDQETEVATVMLGGWRELRRAISFPVSQVRKA